MTPNHCPGGLYPIHPIRAAEPGSLLRPQPPKRSGRQQSVNQAVDDFFDNHAPRLPLPDAICQLAQTVGHERHRAPG